MLDLLCAADQRGVADRTLLDFLDRVLALADQAFHAFALDPLELQAKRVRDLFDALDLHEGLFQVGFEGGGQLLVLDGLGQPRQGLGHLLFGAVGVGQFVEEKVFHRLDGHGAAPWGGSRSIRPGVCSQREKPLNRPAGIASCRLARGCVIAGACPLQAG